MHTLSLSPAFGTKIAPHAHAISPQPSEVEVPLVDTVKGVGMRREEDDFDRSEIVSGEEKGVDDVE
jgi:hypothetical protein